MMMQGWDLKLIEALLLVTRLTRGNEKIAAISCSQQWQEDQLLEVK